MTLNSKLLGGKISFFQSVCVLGYCIFPLVLVSFITFAMGAGILRLIFVLGGFAWSVYASVGFLAEVNLEKRRTLAVYPIFFFYFVLSLLVFIYKSLTSHRFYWIKKKNSYCVFNKIL